MLNPIKCVLPWILVPLLLISGHGDRRTDPSLLVYDFNLGLGPTANVDHVKSLGFDGIVTRVEFPSDVNKLRAYVGHVRTMADFELLAFVPYDFTNPSSPQVWRDALPILARVKAPLWVIVKNAPSAPDVRQLLGQMASDSQAVGIETVIYPHWNTDIESAADASALIREVGHSNLKNSLHTCHEIRSGHQSTLQTVASKYAKATALVTIAGADANAYSGPFVPGIGWDDAIKPLDKGAFSLLPFLQGLHDAGYNGPVVLHTFGITGDPNHLQRSLRRYDDYLGQVVP